MDKAEEWQGYYQPYLAKARRHEVEPVAILDCVYSFTAFFHFDFELVVHYFSEIARVLRPGGTAIVEFKQWRSAGDVNQLLEKIEEQGGLAAYERQLDKWRYVSSDMLALVCDFYSLDVVDPDTTKFTFHLESTRAGSSGSLTGPGPD